MLSEQQIDEVRALYRDAKYPDKQIGILAELYAVPCTQICEIVGHTANRPKAQAKNEKARAKWDEQKTALLISMVDEGKTLKDMAKMLGFTMEQVRSKLAILGVRLPKTKRELPAVLSVQDETTRTLADTLREVDGAVRIALQSDRVAYLAFAWLTGSAKLDMPYCWRAAIAEIDKITTAWADRICRHPDAEDAFAQVIALLTMDELLERGGETK